MVCLNWGERYGPRYVNNLYRGVARHLSPPFRFLCYTDSGKGLLSEVEQRPLDSLEAHPRMHNHPFLKLSVIHERAGLSGHCLFLDLDVVIVGSLDVFFTHRVPHGFCIVHNWIEAHKRILRAPPNIGNSSVFRFEAGRFADVLERYLEDPEWAEAAFPTEQAFLSHVLGERLAYFPSPWVRSYKRHCHRPFPLNWILRPHMPQAARILVFHGRPDPHQVIAGYRGGWRKRCCPWPQLAQYWS